MKKTMLIVSALLALCFVCGCSGQNGGAYEPPVHAVSTQTPEPTAVPAPTPTAKPSSWSLKYFVDEFGDETDEYYVGSKKIQGTFSNTIVDDADLTVSIIYDQINRVGFRFSLLQHGRTKAIHLSSDDIVLKFKFDDKIYSCNLKAGDSMTSDVYTGMDDMYESDVEAIRILRDEMLRGSSFDCLIYIGESKYQFRIPGDGFYDAMQEYVDLIGE